MDALASCADQSLDAVPLMTRTSSISPWNFLALAVEPQSTPPRKKLSPGVGTPAERTSPATTTPSTVSVVRCTSPASLVSVGKTTSSA